MTWWTFTIGRADARIRFRAESSGEATRKASEFGMKHGLMLIGPRELDDQPIYERARIS